MASSARLLKFPRVSALMLALGLAAAGGADALAQAAAPAQTTAPAQAKKPAPATAPTPAAAEANPQATTATYGDWTVRCVAAQPQGGKVCEAATGVQAQGQQGLLAQVVVGRLAKDQPPRLVVQLPAGVFLPPGATLYLDEKTQSGIDTAFSTCPRSCFADVELKADQLAALKATKGPGRLEFVDGARKRVAVPISFNGFAAAADAALNAKD
ncbi:invasion associated locus B family protein [Xanthobacter sediminis]|uniref:invasion associated locus B family protein n=1 Tax=Xanthobacter sediminis TaxID=3119926 RepID=UPI0037268003